MHVLINQIRPDPVLLIDPFQLLSFNYSNNVIIFIKGIESRVKTRADDELGLYSYQDCQRYAPRSSLLWRLNKSIISGKWMLFSSYCNGYYCPYDSKSCVYILYYHAICGSKTPLKRNFWYWSFLCVYVYVLVLVHMCVCLHVSAYSSWLL